MTIDLIMSLMVCFQTGPFSLNSPPLTTYNQQLWLTCVMQAENSNSKTTEWAVWHDSWMLREFLNVLNNNHYCCLCQWETSSSPLRSTLSLREWCRTPAWCTSTPCTRSHGHCTVGLWVSVSILALFFFSWWASQAAETVCVDEILFKDTRWGCSSKVSMGLNWFTVLVGDRC